MKCPECLGVLFTPGLYTMAQVFKEQPVLIQNVSGAKCNQCGFLVVDASVGKEIENALGRLPDMSVPANVYNLASPAKERSVTRTAPVDTKVISNIAAV